MSDNDTLSYNLPSESTSYCNPSVANNTCNYNVGTNNLYTGDVEYLSYGYNVSKAIATVFLILFAISTVLHFGQAVFYKRWWLLYTIFLFGVGETIGWAGRAWSAYSAKWVPDVGGFFFSNHDAFIMQICCLIISPAFAAAANYLLLKRIVPILGNEYLFIHPATYTAIFVGGDVISLVVQAIGGGVSSGATDDKTANQGANIASAGVFIQLAIMVGYTLVLTSFVYRFVTHWPVQRQLELFRWWPNALRGKKYKKYNSGGSAVGLTTVKPEMRSPGDNSPGYRKGSEAGLQGEGYTDKHRRGAKILLLACALSTLLIFIRSIYRSIELLGGWSGPIIENQLLFDTLDGMMMVLAIYLYNIIHPGFFLPRLVGKGDI